MMTHLRLILVLSFLAFFSLADINTGQSYCGADAKLPPLQTSLNLTLLQVQVVTRHGDRTPVDKTNNLTAQPQDVTWNCSLQEYQRPMTYPHEVVPNTGRLYRKAFLPGRETLKGNCAFGQLTSKGLKQHKLLGQAIHDFYEPFGILTQAPVHENVFVRSTNSYRTFQSAEANIFSVFPPESYPDEIVIYTLDSETENMYDNHELCPYISDLHKQRESTPIYQEEQKALYPVRKQVAELGYFSGDVDQVSLGALADTCNCRRCHDFPLLPGITEQIFLEAWTSDQWENWYVYSDRERASWYIGTFFEELVHNMKQCADNSKQGSKCLPGYSMFSGHDSTFYPLLAVLEFTDLHYPPYASHLEMELWQDADSGDLFVRVSHNGVEINAYNCSDGKDGSYLCPFDDFFTSAQQYFPPPDYLEQCEQLASASASAKREHKKLR